VSVLSVSEMEVEMPGEDTAASVSGTETEDYPGTADEDEEPKNEQLSSRVRLPGGIIRHLCFVTMSGFILPKVCKRKFIFY